MSLTTRPVLFAILAVFLLAVPGLAQQAEHGEHDKDPAIETHQEEHADEAEEDEHGGGQGGRPVHNNEIGIFVGLTDEDVYATEPTLGVDYRHRIADRLAVGALFDYAGGNQRNGIIAAALTWIPIGRMNLTAAPGIEFHRARPQGVNCGCGGASASEDDIESDLVDEDATYFVFRLGAGWHFPIGEIYGVSPNINVDFVDGETVLVYGVKFTFAW
jgi:hypothetical protein